MSLQLHSGEIALRLALTVVAGLLVGYNRSEHGKAAGMATTLLVSLAASVAMIQVNLLLPMSGRATDSFVTNDLMRLPLGILTGVGFIGGGVILRRGDVVVGVTTAATLWMMTVIGLCLGGGQLALGVAATALALVALWLVKRLESRLRREFRAHFSIEVDAQGPAEAEIRRRIHGSGLAILSSRCTLEPASDRRTHGYEVRQLRALGDTQTPGLLDELSTQPGVRTIRWEGYS